LTFAQRAERESALGLMASGRLPLSIRGMTLTRIFAVVVALDILGVIVAVSSGLADDSIIVIGTPLSAPFTFIAVQGLAVLAATRYRAGAAVLALLCVVSVASGAFDSSFAAGLTAAERALQLALVVATAVLGAYAARAAIRPRALAVG
jgi:hypothetical protein